MSEISIQSICCTCLSSDRNLYQLCRLLDGINLIYNLFKHDAEANEEGFYNDTTSLRICWECNAVIDRIKRFRTQACVAQKQLTSIANGRNDVKLRSFSRLAIAYNIKPEYEFQSADIVAENFIDCGPVKEIKTESDSDDVPLSAFHYENVSDSNENNEPSNDVNEPSHDHNELVKDAKRASKYINEPDKYVDVKRLRYHEKDFIIDSKPPGYHGNRSDKYTKQIDGETKVIKDAEGPNEDVKEPIQNIDRFFKYNKKRVSNTDINKLCKNAKDTNRDAKELSIRHANRLKKYNNRLDIPETHNIFNIDEKELNKEYTNRDVNLHKTKTKLKHGNIATQNVPVTKSEVENDAIIQSGNTSIEANTHLKSELTSKKKTKMKYSKYVFVYTMSEEEMRKSIESRTLNVKNAIFKCNKCIIQFKTENELINHNTDLHENKKDSHSQCDICHAYTEELPTHREEHYVCYNCLLCVYTAHTHMDIIRHLRRNHRDTICSKKTKESKRKRNGLRLNELSKYPCPECDACFHNKDLRWKHVQRVHRDGHKCSTCDKTFAFKSNLERHERIHSGPLPREECKTCHKMIRVDLVKAHSRIHTDRQTHTCVECDKTFVSRATYESHLKYAQAHATVDVSRYKCPSCPKRYRSRGELRDHVNYLHKGKAEHKCPICGKGLATKRCIRRHVRRTHEGIKENAKDKICQQCGKAFRDKKSLIEHERVHTGARPLSCATCGRAFRQRAALYVHTKRLHSTPRDTT